MEVYLRGRGKINFTKDDYVASGGEAKIYKQGLTAFKIFHKQKDMIPEAKFNELQVITLPNIIKPQEIVTDKNNAPIGFTSNWVEGTPLCKIFVTGYRKRNGITDDHVVKLIGNIKDGIAHVHQNGCVIVDGLSEISQQMSLLHHLIGFHLQLLPVGHLLEFILLKGIILNTNILILRKEQSRECLIKCPYLIKMSKLHLMPE